MPKEHDYCDASDALQAFVKSGKENLECKIWGLEFTVGLKDGYYVMNFHHNDGFDRPWSGAWDRLAKEHSLENDYIYFYGTGDKKGMLVAEVQDDLIRIKADQLNPKLANDLFKLYEEGVSSSRSSCRHLVANYKNDKIVAIRDDTPKTRDHFLPSNWSPPKE